MFLGVFMKSEVKSDIFFLIYKDIIEFQLNAMRNDNEFKDRIANVSSVVLHDAVDALNLLTYDNGTQIMVDGENISLNSYVKQLINLHGTNIDDYLNKLLSSNNLNAKQKSDISRYSKISNIDSDAVQLILNLINENINFDELERVYGTFDKQSPNYIHQLEKLSKYKFANELLKSFPDNIRQSLNRNLLFALENKTNIEQLKSKANDDVAPTINPHKNENLSQENSTKSQVGELEQKPIQEDNKNAKTKQLNYSQKITLTANDEFLKQIVASIIDSDLKIGTKEFHDYIYQIINSSEFKQNYSIDDTSKKQFSKMILNDAKEANFAIDPNKTPKNISAGWNTFQSWNLFGGEKIKKDDFKHRFYIAARPDKMYDIAMFLYEEYKNKNIPFYFKLNNQTNDGKLASKKDNIVIYTSDKYLFDNLDIMHKLSSECKAMDFCEETSPIVGKLEDKIGYAAEKPGENTESYTSRFSIAIAKALESFVTTTKQNNLTYDEFYEKLKQDLKQLQKTNPQKIYETIRKSLQSHGFDTSNLCANKQLFELLEQYAQNTETNLTA